MRIKTLCLGMMCMAIAALAGCSWVDDTGKQTNETPEILLDQSFLAYEEGDVIRVTLADDDPVSTRFELIDSGPTVAGACSEFFTPIESAETLESACAGYLSAEQCAIEFATAVDDDKIYTATIPALTQSIAQRYLVHVEDRTGAFDEREFDLCLVAINNAPLAEDDQYQVVYRDTLLTEDQVYNEQCGTESGDGVLSNDTDDFDPNSASNDGPACLRAELVESPYPGFELGAGGGFSFTSDGTVAPGQSHSFTYRASDGELSTEATVEILVVGENSPPTLPDTVRVDGTENSSIDIDVLQYADDDDTPDALTVRSLGEPANGGRVETTDTNRVRYTPGLDFVGEDEFSVTIADPAGATAGTTVIVNVREINDPPTVNVPGSQSFSGEQLRSVTAIVDDQETDRQALVVSATSNDTAVARARTVGGPSANGQVSIEITPVSNGSTTVTVSVTDQPRNGLPAETTRASFSVRISGINTAPNANNDTLTIASGASGSINVGDNDSDPDGDDLNFTITNADGLNASIGASSGVLTVNATPTPETLNRTVVYQISDGRGGIDTANVTVTVTAATNQPPTVTVPGSQSFSGEQVRTVSFTVDDQETDRRALVVSATSSDSAIARARTLGGPNADGQVSIEITPVGNGSTTVTVSVTDQALSNGAAAENTTASFSVRISGLNTDPTANPDTLTVASAASGSVNVGSNDSDPDGDDLTFTITNADGLNVSLGASSGLLTVNAPVTLTTLNRTVVYQISDGRGGTDTAQVAVTITAAPNEPPQAGNDTLNLASGASGNVNVRSNDTDPDGNNNALTYTLLDADGLDATLSSAGVLSVTAPTTSSDQSFTLRYRVTDERGGTTTANVAVSVTGAPNQPPLASNDTISVASGASGTVNVRSNDSDPDGDNSTMTYTLLDADGMDAGLSTAGILSVNAPTTTSNLSFTLRYRVTDEDGGRATANVSVTVTAAPNQPPQAANDSFSLESGTNGSVDVSSNDSDPDGNNNAMTYTLLDADGLTANLSSAGVLSISAPLASSDASYTLRYRVTDERNGTATANVNVTVTAAPNQPPQAGNDTLTLASGASGQINVGANDSDPNGDTLSFAVTNTGGLTVSLNAASGVMDITAPATAALINRTVAYTVEDTRGETDSANVSVTVEPPPTLPDAPEVTPETDATDDTGGTATDQ